MQILALDLILVLVVGACWPPRMIVDPPPVERPKVCEVGGREYLRTTNGILIERMELE